MSQKQKILAGAIALVGVVLFGVIYSQFSDQTSIPGGSNLQVDNAVSNQRTRAQNPEPVVPATPDGAVDAIINDSSLDDKALQDETGSEQDAITASGAEINNLTQTYDENQL